jgi:hypothetical protein
MFIKTFLDLTIIAFIKHIINGYYVLFSYLIASYWYSNNWKEFFNDFCMFLINLKSKLFGTYFIIMSSIFIIIPMIKIFIVLVGVLFTIITPNSLLSFMDQFNYNSENFINTNYIFSIPINMKEFTYIYSYLIIIEIDSIFNNFLDFSNSDSTQNTSSAGFTGSGGGEPNNFNEPEGSGNNPNSNPNNNDSLLMPDNPNSNLDEEGKNKDQNLSENQELDNDEKNKNIDSALEISESDIEQDLPASSSSSCWGSGWASGSGKVDEFSPNALRPTPADYTGFGKGTRNVLMSLSDLLAEQRAASNNLDSYSDYDSENESNYQPETEEEKLARWERNRKIEESEELQELAQTNPGHFSDSGYQNFLSGKELTINDLKNPNHVIVETVGPNWTHNFPGRIDPKVNPITTTYYPIPDQIINSDSINADSDLNDQELPINQDSSNLANSDQDSYNLASSNLNNQELPIDQDSSSLVSEASSSESSIDSPESQTKESLSSKSLGKRKA